MPPEPEWDDEHDLAPVDHLEQLLANATGALLDVASMAGNITDPLELWHLIETHRATIKIAVANAESELVSLAHVAISDLGGELCLADGRVIEAGWQGGSKKWDGPRLVPAVASRLTDEFAVDRSTGEVAPPAVFAGNVAHRVAECLGGFAPSTQWRSGPLEKLGLDPADYRTSEPGRIKVAPKAPKPNRTPLEEAA